MVRDKVFLTEMLRRVLRIRYFEEAVIRLQKRGEIPGGVHLCIGQEAAIVGACMAAGDNAWMTGYHRSHGHPIGKGAALAPLMAELLARSTGVCKGKGGSLHLADFAVGSLGESGIVAGSLPIATGAALGASLRGDSERIVLAFLGDAATGAGAFHEAINMAAAWRLPVVFVCENNLYGVTTPTAEVCNLQDMAQRAAGYGIPGVIVDGQDPLAVFDAVATACTRARNGEGPTFVEAKTYRFRDHAESLVGAAPYRSDEEVREWMELRDPVRNFPALLLQRELISSAELDQVMAAAAAEVAAAVEFARRSPHPVAADAYDDLYCPTAPQRNSIATHTVDRPEPQQRRDMIYLAAINEAQREELERDPAVIVFGEDVRCNLWGGTGFAQDFPKNRVFDTPLSETGFVGASLGAAMTGMRPVVDMTIANFLYAAMDQFVNQAAKTRYMSGGQARLPVTFRVSMMYGMALGAHHSDRPYPAFMNVPGLKIIAPASAFDAKGLLKAAIRDDNPVLCFEDANLWLCSGHVPAEDYVVPLGVADIKRRGSDVTLVGIAGGVRTALEAAAELATQGIEAEVVDPRTLAPLDIDTIVQSVVRTGYLVVVDPAHRTCGAGAEICCRVVELAFDSLRAAPLRLNAQDTQIPFAPEMEVPLFPRKDAVVAGVRALLKA